MNDFVLSLDAVRQQHADHVGGKAAVLGTLFEAGFPVPPGLCVTTAAFHAALTPFRPQIHELLGQLDLHQPEMAAEQATTAAAKIAALLADLVVPASVAGAIRAALSAVAGDDIPFAPPRLPRIVLMPASPANTVLYSVCVARPPSSPPSSNAGAPFLLPMP